MLSLLGLRSVFVVGLVTAAPGVAGAAAHPAAASSASAEGVSGFEMALRGGAAFPLGEVSSGAKLKDHVSALIPFQLDMGVRFSPLIFVGGFFQYAPGLAQNCKSCTLTDLRAGALLQVHPVSDSAADPWIGLGAGYEWFHTDSPNALGSPYNEVSGFEFGDLQLGFNIQVSKSLGVGPYAGASVGRFRRVSGSFTVGPTTVTGSSSISNQSLHGWLSAGLRVVFDIR